MNTAQITALVKQLLSAAAGYLMVHGYSASASIINAQDTIGLATLLVVWIWSHFFTHSDEAEATATPLPASKGGGVLPPAVSLFIMLCMFAFLIGAAIGCASQNKRLELGGAYNPATSLVATNDAGVVSTNLVGTGTGDFKLYAADAAFDFAYSTLETAFKLERDNREFLWKLSPDIKHGLDAIRPKASKAVAAYTVARLKYIAVPLDENATGLDSALADFQALSDAASAATSSFNVPATLNQ